MSSQNEVRYSGIIHNKYWYSSGVGALARIGIQLKVLLRGAFSILILYFLVFALIIAPDNSTSFD